MRLMGIPILALTLATVLTLAVPITSAQAPTAPTYALKATIPIPTWDDLSTISLDIGWVSPDGKTFAFGDRSPQGGAIEVFDAVNYQFIGAAGLGSFVGVAPTGSAGPNGVVAVGPDEWAGGDGNSTLKVVNVRTGAVQSIDAGGDHRVDEMAYDPFTDILMAANDRESGGANFVTFFKIHPLSILGKIPYPHAPGGLEQPVVANGKFFFAVPATAANPGGEINLVDPTTMSIEKVITVGDCRPTGMAPGIGGRLVTSSGCVVDPWTGNLIARITDAGGDEMASIPSMGVYAFVIAGTETLNLADASTNRVYQKLPVAGGHNLAINQANGEIWVPDVTSKSVLVFAPA